MNANLMIFTLFGGVLLLLYGVRLAGDGLKGWAGPRIKTTLETMTRNRLMALVSGTAVTFLLQSSSATTVSVVSLIDSGLMTFPQSVGVILGSDIGTTITVQLIAFDVYQFAPFICGLGVLLLFVGGNARRQSAGQGVLGFGLIFLSIGLLSGAMGPLKDNRLFHELLMEVGGNPLLGVIIAGVFTAIVHSSAATVGIALSLSLQGLIDLHAALPLVLGANIGTCATALASALNSTTEARRAAWAHTIFKVLGVILVLPFLSPFADLVRLTAETAPRQIANAHTIFNVALAFLFLPFTSIFARLIEKWVPEKETGEEDEGKPKYLNPATLKTPSLALAQATRETLRMAETVQDMLRMSLPAIMECDPSLIEKVETMDDRVDRLDRAIRFFLTQLSKNNLSPEEAHKQMEILLVISNLESIGDLIDKNLMELARKKARKCVQFSPEGKKDIEDLHARVLEDLELAMDAFTANDRDLANRVVRNKARIRDLQNEYYRRHIERLEAGLSESFETSSIHLDILTNLKRVATHVTSLVYPILEPTLPEGAILE